MDEKRLDRFERYFELLQQQLLEIHDQVTSLQGDITSMQGDITSMQGDITSMKGDITSMQGDITSMKGATGSMQADIASMKGDISDLKTEQRALRVEMNERFESVHDQLRTLTLRAQMVEGRLDDGLFIVKRLDERMAAVEKSVLDLAARVDHVGDDIRQRFRVVTERLTSIEKRDAA